MIKTVYTPELGTIEKILLIADDGVIGALLRLAGGFAAQPAMSLLVRNNALDWVLVPFLLSILLLIRIVPAIVRRLVPFSRTLQERWAQRRRMAKRYDSYQWRKLLWIGMGLALYITVSGQHSLPRIAVCSTCLLVGAAGMARWRAVSADGRSAGGSTDVARSIP